MTNEEVIEILDILSAEYYPNALEKEALDMAIKALEQQPCDCISRVKALEMLGDEPENWTDTEREIQEVNDYRWFKSILEELPSVTPSYNSINTELKPSEDCISREEAIGIVARIKEMHIDDREQYPINYGTICDIDLELQQLSPVTPQHIAGK